MTAIMGSQYRPSLPPRNNSTCDRTVTHVKVGFSHNQVGISGRSQSVEEHHHQNPRQRRGSEPAPPLPRRESRTPADGQPNITRQPFETKCEYL